MFFTLLYFSLSRSSSQFDLDLAAQLLSDSISIRKFEASIRQLLSVDNVMTLPQQMQDRLKWIQGIPFAAIVTTNYDGLLKGTDPQDSAQFGDTAFKILRSRLDEFQMLEALAFKSSQQIPIVKLHGDVDRLDSELICTREGYRKLLHGSSQYATFVKTLLATHTVLYMGFSFTDAYINELRSEVMNLYTNNSSIRSTDSQHLSKNAPKAPLAYALMSDVGEIQKSALLLHDGLQIISYNTKNGTDFSGFDSFLCSLYMKSNPSMKFGALLHKRSVLWLHHNWAASTDTKHLKGYLEEANRAVNNFISSNNRLTVEMELTASASHCIQLLNEKIFDCVICCYDTASDYQPINKPNSSDDSGSVHHHRSEEEIGKETRAVLQAMGTVKYPSAVVVFGYNHCTLQRRSKLLRLGARCYTYKYYELLTELSLVLNHCYNC